MLEFLHLLAFVLSIPVLACLLAYLVTSYKTDKLERRIAELEADND